MAVQGDNSLFFTTGIDNSGLQQGADEATGIIEGLAQSIGAINPFAALAAGAVAAFGTIATESYKMMKDFETAMKEVETISKSVQDNFTGMSEAVLNLSKVTPDRPRKLANAFYQIVSAGYDGAEGLELLETAARAAVAGVTDTQVAADGITTAMNAFNLEANEAERIADAFFKTVELGKTTMEELAANLNNVASLASSFGFSLEEVLAATATLTKQGVPTSKAMTQIRAAIQGIGQELGDTASESMTLQEAFQELYNMAGGSQTELRKMIGRVEGVNAVLATTGENARVAAADLREVGDATGSMSSAYSSQMESTQNQWSIFWNNIRASISSVGDSLASTSSGFAEAMNDMMNGSTMFTGVLGEQIRETNELAISLKNAEEGSREWDEIRDQITEKYPEFLQNIDAETISQEGLLSVLERVNQQYQQRYLIQNSRDRLKRAESDQEQAAINEEEARAQLQNVIANLQDLAETKDISVNLDFSAIDEQGRVRTPEEMYQHVLDQFKKAQPGVDLHPDFAPGRLMHPDGEVSEALNKLKDLKDAAIENREAFLESQEKYQEALRTQRRIVQNELEDSNSFGAWKKDISEANSVEELDRIENLLTGTNEEISEKNKELLELVHDRRGLILELAALHRAEGLENELMVKNFLNSSHEEVRKAAQDVLDAWKNVSEGVNDEGEKTFDDYLKDFKSMLRQKRQDYNKYLSVVEVFGQEEADRLFAPMLEKGATFKEFLQNLLKDENLHDAYKVEIGFVANQDDLELIRKEVEAVLDDEGVKEDVKKIRVKILPELDGTAASVELIERRIEQLKDKLKVTEDDAKAEKIRSQIDQLTAAIQNIQGGTIQEMEQQIRDLEAQKKIAPSIERVAELNKKIDELQARVDKWRNAGRDQVESQDQGSGMPEEDRHGANLVTTYAEMTQQRLQKEREFWQKVKAMAKTNLDQFGHMVEKANEEIELIDKAMADNMADSLRSISGALSSAGDMFRRFGDDALGDVMDKLSGLADGIATAVTGFGTGNWFQMAGGILSGITSLFGSDDADRLSAYEEAIEKLDNSIDKLGSQIERAFGTDAIELQKEQIQDYLDKVEELEDKIEKQKEFIDIISVFPFADQIQAEMDKLEEMKAELEEFKTEHHSAVMAFYEELTGTTSETLTDAIIQGFRDGKRGIEDFAQTFEDVMKDMMLRTFQNRFLEEQMADFYEQLAGATADGTSLTKYEMEDLKELWDSIITEGTAQIDTLNEFLERSGMNPIGYEDPGQKPGLSGEIQNITEDTANILEGYVNALRLDVRQGLQVAQMQTQLLSQISTYTYESSETLRSMDGRLATIEDAFLASQAQ